MYDKGKVVPFGDKKTSAEMVILLHRFLTLERDGISIRFHAPHLYPEKCSHPIFSNHIVRWVVGASLDAFESRKVYCPFRTEIL